LFCTAEKFDFLLYENRVRAGALSVSEQGVEKTTGPCRQAITGQCRDEKIHEIKKNGERGV
jgi:hypothetical protein